MGKSRLSTGLILLFIPAFFGCTVLVRNGVDGQYDHSPVYLDAGKREIEKITANLFRIETSVRFELGELTPTATAAGLAISLDRRHLLTARHVVKIDSIQTMTPLGPLELELSEENKIEERSAIVFDDGSRLKIEVIYDDKEKDFVLLRAEREISHVPFRIGNSDEFKAGDFVFLFGNFQTGWNIRAGYLTQLDFVRYGARGEVSQTGEELFGFSAVTVEGDSGAPVFLIRDGELELGGIVTFLYGPARGLGFGVKINPIMNRLRKVLDRQGAATGFPAILPTLSSRPGK